MYQSKLIESLLGFSTHGGLLEKRVYLPWPPRGVSREGGTLQAELTLSPEITKTIALETAELPNQMLSEGGMIHRCLMMARERLAEVRFLIRCVRNMERNCN
jgi:hypothetical protein